MRPDCPDDVLICQQSIRKVIKAMSHWITRCWTAQHRQASSHLGLNSLLSLSFSLSHPLTPLSPSLPLSQSFYLSFPLSLSFSFFSTLSLTLLLLSFCLSTPSHHLYILFSLSYFFLFSMHPSLMVPLYLFLSPHHCSSFTFFLYLSIFNPQLFYQSLCLSSTIFSYLCEATVSKTFLSTSLLSVFTLSSLSLSLSLSLFLSLAHLSSLGRSSSYSPSISPLKCQQSASCTSSLAHTRTHPPSLSFPFCSSLSLSFSSLSREQQK